MAISRIKSKDESKLKNAAKLDEEIVYEDLGSLEANPTATHAFSRNSVITFAAVPASVDNSLLPSFPPVRDQGGLGACISFASTYYLLSREICLIRGCNNRSAASPTILSPRWTYTAAGLDLLKQYRANGHVATFGTNVYGWLGAKITGTGNGAGQVAIFSYDASKGGGHAMTVVGYDDNVWIDQNNNGIVDPGETGALRIVNQWGTSWGTGGFVWVPYSFLGGTSTHQNYGTFKGTLTVTNGKMRKPPLRL